MINEKAKKYYEEKYAKCEKTSEFINMVEDEISIYYEIIDERYEADEDADVTDCEKVIESIKSNAVHRGMTYTLLKEFLNSNEAVDVFWIIPLKKNNLEDLKKQLWESCLGYSDAFTDEEVAREQAMTDAYYQIKTIKGLKQWLKDFDILEYYGLRIWKNQLVDAMDY